MAQIIVCETGPDLAQFWVALSGCGQADPGRKKAGVQESSGLFPAIASVPARGPNVDRMRIGPGMFIGCLLLWRRTRIMDFLDPVRLFIIIRLNGFDVALFFFSF